MKHEGTGLSIRVYSDKAASSKERIYLCLGRNIVCPFSRGSLHNEKGVDTGGILLCSRQVQFITRNVIIAFVTSKA